MESQTKVNVRPVDQVAVLEIEGDFTSSADTALEKAFEEAVQTHKKLVLSFREQDSINSAGIALVIDMLSLSQNAHKGAVTLRIAHPSDHFRKIFNMVGLSRYVPICASVEEALRDY